MTMKVSLRINDSVHNLDLPAETMLLSVLRDDLGLVGTRFGCGHGVCGACYVLVDGTAAPACKLSLTEVEGREIRTIEGIADGDALHRVQRSFLEEDAMQCGYCTSGMIISAVALLGHTPHPSNDEIRSALAPHLCRCGIYLRAVRAISKAIE
jgi:aerobic-type carbon monoxide dehydrogenase small subunit (CoxS/CutS family)